MTVKSTESQAERTPERPLVASHQNQIEGNGVAGDQEVVEADHLGSLVRMPAQARSHPVASPRKAAAPRTRAPRRSWAALVSHKRN